MRAALVAGLLVSGGRVAAGSQQPHQGTGDRSSITDEGVFQARQAFREIHDKLLANGDIRWDPRLGAYGSNVSGYGGEEWNAGLDMEMDDDDESGSVSEEAASSIKSKSKSSHLPSPGYCVWGSSWETLTLIYAQP